MGTKAVNSGEQMDRQSRILEAALDLLSRHGISGVSMRAVAREAGVALGLVTYYYDDKTSLIRAALRRVDENFELEPLDDAAERHAFDSISNRITGGRG